jgi:phenylalanine-4-hydroxylase
VTEPTRDLYVFEEAQLYAPTMTAPTARSRMRAGPIPRVDYTEEDQEVWRRVCREQAATHGRLVCAEHRDAMATPSLPADRLPK